MTARRLSDAERERAEALADEIGWPVVDDDDLADLAEVADVMAWQAPDPGAEDGESGAVRPGDARQAHG